MRSHIVSASMVLEGIHLFINVPDRDDDESSNLIEYISKKIRRLPDRYAFSISFREEGDSILLEHFFDGTLVRTEHGTDDILEFLEEFLEKNKC